LRFYCQRMLMQMLAMLVPLAAVLVIAAPTLLDAFGAQYGKEGASLLRWLAVASIPAVVVTLASSVARVQERPRLLAVLGAAVAVPLIGLTYALLPELGIDGVGVAVLATNSVLAVVLLLTVLRPFLLPVRHRPGEDAG
jgi:O-antigen/teichoic acid export membrane protein